MQTATSSTKKVRNGDRLVLNVLSKASALGLVGAKQVVHGTRFFSTKHKRIIDVVLSHPTTNLQLGIECKYQATSGSTEDKVLGTIQDIEHWDIPGCIVFSGCGWSEGIKDFLLSKGHIEFENLVPYLKRHFSIP